MSPWLRKKWILHAAILACCTGGVWAAEREPSITPSVHPTLSPASAIELPMRLSSDQTFVWRSDQEQRMLLSGQVKVSIGYRLLKADNAAIWLTPSVESGEGVYDVAVYLSGHVEVREGSAASATRTAGKELLVTARISQSVEMVGQPVSRAVEDSPIVMRGAELRRDVLTRPQLASFLPRIFFTPEEDALQAGWIAKGPGNRIIAGPAEIQLVRDENGNIIPGAFPQAVRPPRPRPSLFVTGDEERTKENGNELVHILPNAYVFYDARDGKPPLEFRAQQVVVFTPRQQPAGSEPAGSQPAGTGPAGASAGGLPATESSTGAASPSPADAGSAASPAAASPGAPAAGPATAATRPGRNLAEIVTGIYFEGDVTLNQGDQVSVHAERMYYDFTSNRAIMLDATLSTFDQQRNVPIYLRATEVRQLARGEFAAKKATFSTSEFFTPHYAIGAGDIYLRDITPVSELPAGEGAPNPGGVDVTLAGVGGNLTQRTYQFQAKDATIDVQGVPVFYWPYLSGNTAKNEIPLRTIRVSNSRTYGPSVLTDWDLFGLLNQPEPTGVRANLNVDFFGKRGPAGGVQSNWLFDDDHGLFRSYALWDQGTDRLGADVTDVAPQQQARGRVTFRDQRDLGDGWSLQTEASYISDPTFLEEFFQREFDSDKEQETSAYLKKQGETDALTFLGKFNLMDFTATADQVDDQYTTEKKPEVKYWRIGDSISDLFTYYSETSASNLHTDITSFTPQQVGLLTGFTGLPAEVVPLNTTFRNYYKSQGYTTGDVLRGDTRQELDMPLQIGDAKITPYVTGRFTFWNTSFPDDGDGGDTTRSWGSAGLRSSMTFWRVYNEVESQFLDVHHLRHIVEPQLILFATASNKDRDDLQLFDRDVEGISKASGMQLALNQTFQTKRAASPPAGSPPGTLPTWRDVDWITFNLSWNQFWDRDRTSSLFPYDPVRGFIFPSRPDLSLVANSINADGTWRVGEHFRLTGEGDYSLDSHRMEQAAAGVAVDQSPSLTYFFGNRYIRELATDEWTVATDYQLTQKYRIIAAESYDDDEGRNILTSLTLIRSMPRLNAAITITYDANNADTSVVFTAWPEGLTDTLFGNNVGGAADRR